MKSFRFSARGLRGGFPAIGGIFACMAVLMIMMSLWSSCSGLFVTPSCSLTVSVADDALYSSFTGLPSLTDAAIPDKDDFILDVKSASGKSVYYGRFGDSPERFDLKPGSYIVSAKSREFVKPEYDTPQFGDTQVVMIKENQSASVRLLCRQVNGGLRLVTDGSFRDSFPDGKFVLACESGSLECEYDESRYAFFPSGRVAVSYIDDSGTKGLFGRHLSEGQMLEVVVSAGLDAAQGSRISVSTDTSRVWSREEFVFGDRDASYIENAYSVMEAIDFAPQKDVWVYGYVVGVATSTGKYAFEPPFTKKTNVILAPRAFTDDPQYCISVELKSGDIRDELNLSDNPTVKGRQLYIKGDLVESYFGMPGLKNVAEYQFK
ncbi:MAG TPA: hypothetical protein DCW53_05735 [Rikenellaceae bacterium]|nr:hypothetical protein [Rikenellaceae bacterium]